MRTIATRLKDDNTKKKVLEIIGPTPEVLLTMKFDPARHIPPSQTEPNAIILSMVTTLTPARDGYQNVGKVIEVEANVRKLKVGDVLYLSRDRAEYCLQATR